MNNTININVFELTHFRFDVLFEKDKNYNHNLYFHGHNAYELFQQYEADFISGDSKIKYINCFEASDNIQNVGETSWIIDKLKNVLKEDKINPKLVMFKEQDYDNPEYQKEIDEYIKLGRGYNLGVILVSENKHYPNVLKDCYNIAFTDMNQDNIEYSDTHRVWA